MMNTLFTYTTTTRNATVTTTYWCTWEHACKVAEMFLLYNVGSDNFVATWYDDKTKKPILRRKFYLGEDFITGEPVVYVNDTEY